jgi:hypothetical protein
MMRSGGIDIEGPAGFHMGLYHIFLYIVFPGDGDPDL